VTAATSAEAAETEMAAHTGVETQHRGASARAQNRKARPAAIAGSVDLILIGRGALAGIGIGRGRQITGIGLSVRLCAGADQKCSGGGDRESDFGHHE
jgi:hypothetical protein